MGGPFLLGDRGAEVNRRLAQSIANVSRAGSAARLTALEANVRARGWSLGSYPFNSLATLIFEMRQRIAIRAREMTLQEARAYLEEHKAEVLSAYGVGVEHLIDVVTSDSAMAARVVQGVALTLAGIALGAALGGPIGAVVGGAIGIVCGIIFGLVPFEKIAFAEEWKRWLTGLTVIDRYGILAGMREMQTHAWERNGRDPDYLWNPQVPEWQIQAYAGQLIQLGLAGSPDYSGLVAQNCHDLVFHEGGCVPDPRLPIPTTLADPKTWDQLALYGTCVMISDCGNPAIAYSGDIRKDPEMGLKSKQPVRESFGYDLICKQSKGSTWLRPYLEAVKDWPAGNLRSYAAQWSSFGGTRRGALSLAKTSGTQGFSPTSSPDMPDHRFAPVTPAIADAVSARNAELAARIAAGPVESSR